MVKRVISPSSLHEDEVVHLLDNSEAGHADRQQSGPPEPDVNASAAD